MDLLIRQSANLIDISIDGVNGLPRELIDALTPMLTYTHKRTLHGAESYDPITGERRRVQITHPKLYRIDSDRICTGAGFTQAVTTKLQELGHRVYYVDLTPAHPRADRYNVHPAAVDGLIQYRARQDECVAAIIASRGGIIKAPTGFGKTTMMSACSLIHPKAKVHIVVKQVSIAYRILRQLTKFLPSVGMIGDGKYKPGRVTVITADSLHKSDGDADFLFVDECIAGDAKIATPTGYKLMRDIIIGDRVLCHDGSRVVVRAVTNKWFKGNRPTVLVSAGLSQLRCTPCHVVACGSGWSRVSNLATSALLWQLSDSGRDADGCRLASVEPSTDTDVWDIEVEGCHNFFADGLLVHNCHQIVTDNYSTKIAERYKYSRNFGFSATPYARSDGAHARLHSMFGPTIFEMTYQEAVALGLTVQIKVHWLPIRMDRNPAAGKTNDVVRKRHGIWQNEYRNSEIGKAVAELDPDSQTLVLVETVEHAVHLWRHMPTFQLCYSEMKPHDHQEYIRKGFLPPDFVNVTSEMRYNMQLAFERCELKRVIATDVWSTGVDFDNLSTVVRADARDSEIMDTQGPGRASRVKEGKPHGNVIDTIDYFDRNWQTKSRGRFLTYESLGWEQDWPTGRRHFAQAENTKNNRT